MPKSTPIIGSNFDVRGLQVPMNDSVFVRQFERFCNLACQPERFLLRNGTSCDAFGKSLPFDEPHHARRCAAGQL